MAEDLEKLKKDYLPLQEKYSLPDFDFLNEKFQIEKTAESETDFLLREIRGHISNKFFNYLRFVESLINPTNGPMFLFAVIKTLGENEKEKLTQIYKQMAKVDIELIELDLAYSEEKEAEAIKKYSELWTKIEKELLEIISVVKNNLDNKEENGKGNYLG